MTDNTNEGGMKRGLHFVTARAAVVVVNYLRDRNTASLAIDNDAARFSHGLDSTTISSLRFPTYVYFLRRRFVIYGY